MTRALTRIPPPDGRRTLVCFHYAGGGASTFAGWQALLPELHVCPVQLPGREGRAAEPRHTEFVPLVDDLADELAPVVDRRTIFYGHSMGALVAFGVTRELIARGTEGPAALAVGAYPAPHMPSPLADAQVPDNGRLVSVLTAIGGLPAALLEAPEWLAALLPTVRDDVQLCRTYRHRSNSAVPCPIHAIAATEDRLVAAEQVAAWRLHTTAEFRLYTVSGGHLFVKESPAATAAIVRHVARSCPA
jgi:surfactin synthase thioesterase subunit